MPSLVRWFIGNSVAANLLMILLVLGGISSLFLSVRREQFPTIPPDTIAISVLYPGATPSEVEESICVKIEEAVQEVDDVKRIVSTASENIGQVRVEVVDGVDPREVLDDIKTQVDQINTFPIDAEEAEIELVEVDERAISVALIAKVDDRSLRVLMDEIREELLSLPGITKADVDDGKPYEISIEIEEAALRRFQLTFDQVANAVRNYSINLPAGSVKTRGGEILFRSSAQAYFEEDFVDIPIITQADGSRIVLEDVATVTLGFEDIDLSARIDGRPALLCQVYRVAEQDTSDVATVVEEYVAKKSEQLPKGVDLVIWQNESVDLAARLDMLSSNGILGLSLVFVVLALFLQAKLALWVAVGLVSALLGAVWVMPWIGLTLNFLTSFGFILVLGILVDDAIVVAENIDAQPDRAVDPAGAAQRGTMQVMVPVCLAVVTTGIAFSPMLQLPGRTGTFAASIATVVIVAIAFSLVESLLILPAHLSHGPKKKRSEDDSNQSPETVGFFVESLRALKRVFRPIARLGTGIQGRCAAALTWLIERTYRPSLEWALRNRYLTLAIGGVILCATVGLFGGGHLKLAFFPPIEGNRVIASVAFLPGDPAQQTEAAVRLLESTGRAVLEEVKKETGGTVLRFLRSSIGAQRGVANSGPPDAQGTSSNAGHLGEVHIELTPAEAREISASEISARWRKKLGRQLEYATELNITSDQINVGAPVNVELSSRNFSDLRLAAEELKESIRKLPGTYNITDDDKAGKEELSIVVLPAGEALGLTQREIARQVRQGFYGEEAQRVQIGKDNVKVFVRYDKDERRSLASLDNMRVRISDGSEMPFSDVAAYSLERGPATIKRIDRQRTIVVTSEVDRSSVNANELNQKLETDVFPGLERKYAGLGFRLGGEQSDQNESFTSLAVGMGLAFFLMYALLAVVFRSYGQPLLVLSAIPFGFAGAIWAHYFLGMNLTFLSIIGLLALMGVVVNDSLVLIDFTNRFRREHDDCSAIDAVRMGGPARFRAILLTSLTTFAGLTPILLERSVQAAFIIPMAVSLAFGIAFATFVILLFVPATYVVLDDVITLLKRMVRGRDPEPSLFTLEPRDPDAGVEPPVA